MGTPSLSCNTDALSNALPLVSDDEGPDSSMWVRYDGHTVSASELPSDFLEPLSPGIEIDSSLPPFPSRLPGSSQSSTHECRQFWKSGDFTGSHDGPSFAADGMDHARVHPRFLHSNATSHKWVLGAIAELLDNAVDEIRNGATYAKVDVESNPRNGEPMLVIEDDGGGMDPDCMRRCMSLGYSAKSKLRNTIGQYGNGFKTSTMRLGADVLVFSRSSTEGKRSESIGMLSYTFLTATGQNDIIVPIIDFQTEAFGIRKLIRTDLDDWVESMEAIEKWSPFSSQSELVNQFKSMPHSHGTRIIIYNLWEDEEGIPELDFSADPTDIQIRSTTRDQRSLKMAERFHSCYHYLTYWHSLRTYTSILYLRLPSRFRIFLRGKQVPHHNLRNQMMIVEEVTYRPKDAGNSKAVVTLGFVKDAKEHLDISGFCVYHKNRLIRPFWRIWNPSDTRGRGIIGIVEANFVEPAHDKQGFERTLVLSRLETRLVEMQKSYFSKHCHRIGYINASLTSRVRPKSMDNNGASNGKKKDKGQRDAQHIPTVGTHAQQSAAIGGADGSRAQGIIEKGSESGGVSSATVILPPQDVPANPTRPMDAIISGVERGKGVSFARHDSEHGAQQGNAECAQIAASSGIASADLQTARPPMSMGMPCVIIDLDSPEDDQARDDAVFEIPRPENDDETKPVIELPLPETIILSMAIECDNSMFPSKEASKVVTACPLDNEAGVEMDTEAGPTVDASSSFPAVPSVVKDEEAAPGIEGCSGLHQMSPNLDEIVEASANCLETEICEQVIELVTSGSEAPLAMPIPGLKLSERLQEDDNTLESDMLAPLPAKPMLENAPCQSSILVTNADKEASDHKEASHPVTPSTTLVTNADKEASDLVTPSTILVTNADKEASDPVTPSTILAEPVSASMELDDLFDSLTPHNDVHPPQSSQASNVKDAFSTSHDVDMDQTTSHRPEYSALGTGLPVLFDPSETTERTDTAVGVVRPDDGSLTCEQVTDDSFMPCTDAVEDSDVVQKSAEMEVQQPLTEKATALTNCEEQGGLLTEGNDEMGQGDNGAGSEGNVCREEKDEGHCVSASVMDQILVPPVIPVSISHCTRPEGKEASISQSVDQDAEVLDTTEATSMVTEKDASSLALEPGSICGESATLGSIEASHQAVQQALVVVPEPVTTISGSMMDISSSSCVDPSADDHMSRLLLAMQKIESLQHSIEATVAEAEDLREQLQQHRQVQDSDMENLNTELARALMRLQELQS